MREPFWMDEMLPSPSRPHGWRDEHGRVRDTIPCPRCGRATPLLDPSPEVMRLLRLRPYEEMSIVNWCGHQVDYTPVPRGDGSCQLIPILGGRRDASSGRKKSAHAGHSLPSAAIALPSDYSLIQPASAAKGAHQRHALVNKLLDHLPSALRLGMACWLKCNHRRRDAAEQFLHCLLP